MIHSHIEWKNCEHTVPFRSIWHIPVAVTLWISSSLWHRQPVTVTGLKIRHLVLQAQTASKWQFWMHFVANWDDQKLWKAKYAKTCRNGRFLSWVSEFWHCHTLDLLDIGLGDTWQGPIFDRTLEPVMRDYRIDQNGTVLAKLMLYGGGRTQRAAFSCHFRQASGTDITISFVLSIRQ